MSLKKLFTNSLLFFVMIQILDPMHLSTISSGSNWLTPDIWEWTLSSFVSFLFFVFCFCFCFFISSPFFFNFLKIVFFPFKEWKLNLLKQKNWIPKNVNWFYSIMASIEDSGSFDHSSNLCGTKYFFLFLF